MRRPLILATVAALALSPAAAFAQASTNGGVVGGAVIGGTVGGLIGGTVGIAAEPPAEVRTYVIERHVPSVRVEREVIVGEPIPPTVELRTIPSHTEYRYAIVNERRVIVEPRTRRIIEIVE
jgi:hypothetical protein